MQVSSFIGRARELEQTGAALGEARVVTLTGPGGVGKTRLALQAAGQVLPQYADGAWLCELAPVRDPAGVDDVVAAVFSLTARAGQSTREALVELLRSKQLLLLLDNCEHLLEAAAALAAVLARSCERLVILATSREALGIDGEHLVPVPSLGVPGADADLAAITQAEAVRLFAERAAAVKPDFSVTAGNAAAVAAVVRRLDGIALAIELAAARVPAMTPAELARRLERSFAVLAGGPRGVAARHQTLRATIDWSFQLLAEAEQALLARLAVFAGGCTWRPPKWCAAGTVSIRMRCSSCWRAWWRGRWWWPSEHGPESPLPAAGDDPPVRRGTPRGGRGDRAVAGPPRRLLCGPARTGPRKCPRPAGRGLLGGPADRRAGQPARRVVVGDRHRRRGHRVFDPDRICAN